MYLVVNNVCTNRVELQIVSKSLIYMRLNIANYQIETSNYLKANTLIKNDGV